jgi:PPOX class probable F420-dependent enzyme
VKGEDPFRAAGHTPVNAPNPPLADEPYVNLETFKRDGTGVKTPVWAAPLDGKLVVMSAGNAFKVKRLRRDARARVAACDVRGGLRGPWLEATGRILESAEDVKRAHAALRGKYRWQMPITDFFAWIAGRIKKRAYLEITVTAS